MAIQWQQVEMKERLLAAVIAASSGVSFFHNMPLIISLAHTAENE
jgi:hypothetical protein